MSPACFSRLVHSSPCPVIHQLRPATPSCCPSRLIKTIRIIRSDMARHGIRRATSKQKRRCRKNAANGQGEKRDAMTRRNSGTQDGTQRDETPRRKTTSTDRNAWETRRTTRKARRQAASRTKRRPYQMPYHAPRQVMKTGRRMRRRMRRRTRRTRRHAGRNARDETQNGTQDETTSETGYRKTKRDERHGTAKQATSKAKRRPYQMPSPTGKHGGSETQ